MALEEFEREELDPKDKRYCQHAQHDGLWNGNSLDLHGRFYHILSADHQ